MKLLTIDTTTKVTALALAEDGKLVGENFLFINKTHSERLVPMLDQLLNAAGWDLPDLDLLGVVRGPGSFTGIRIGLATAQGLAQVLKIPLLGVLSLDTIAWAVYGRQEELTVILDARKNEWYSACYIWKQDQGCPFCLVPPRAVRPQVLLEELARLNRPVLFAGDAVPGSGELIRSALGSNAIMLPDYFCLPRGSYAVRAVWKQWQECGGKGEKVIAPFYLRRSEAEEKWIKKGGSYKERFNMIEQNCRVQNRGIVRLMREQDIKYILKIEEKSFPTPWSKQAFINELRENEYARYFCLVYNEEIIGYIGLWFILDEGHITNVAIAPPYRGQGWGEYLMRNVMKRCYEKGMERMTLEVRVSNQVARRLYEHLGFVEAGIRKAYYSDNQENAIIMWVELYGTEKNF